MLSGLLSAQQFSVHPMCEPTAGLPGAGGWDRMLARLITCLSDAWPLLQPPHYNLHTFLSHKNTLRHMIVFNAPGRSIASIHAHLERGQLHCFNLRWIQLELGVKFKTSKLCHCSKVDIKADNAVTARSPAVALCFMNILPAFCAICGASGYAAQCP